MAIGFGWCVRLQRGAGGEALNTREVAGAEVLPRDVGHGLALSPVFLLSLLRGRLGGAFRLTLRVGLDCRTVFEKSPICECRIQIMGFVVFFIRIGS
jgi:hypothetical protein